MTAAIPYRTATLNRGAKITAMASAQPAKHRVGTVTRKTKETSVEVTIDLDGTGICIAETPVGFLNHMLDQIRCCNIRQK